MQHGRIILALGLGLGIPGVGAAQNRAEPVTRVEEVLRRDEARRLAAMVRRDTATTGRYLAAELTYTHSNGQVETRAQHLEAIATGRTVYEAIAPAELSYRWLGPVAVGTGTVKARGSMGGTPFDVVLRVTTVHVERNGHWQLAAWQSTRMP